MAGLTGAISGAVSGAKIGGIPGAIIGGVLGASKNNSASGAINQVAQQALKNGRMATPAEQMKSAGDSLEDDSSPLTMDASDMQNAANYASYEGGKLW